MGKNTEVSLRHLLIYQVYVRNHTEEGTFNALIKDLDRIKDLGTDVLYLLPIHPIGKVNRKGELGSPYAIQDYYGINPELGTLEDFKNLIAQVHAKDMKLMMDIVFNHTSPDSLLRFQHPEYFYRNQTGDFANRVGDWWDIIDFDYTRDEGLWKYLIENLVYWTKLGVDGFRFDVSSFLPLEFLKKSHKAVRAINPETIWLSESVHEEFLRLIRNSGFECLSECELFQVFDLAYDYDTHVEFEKFLKGEGPLEDYAKAIMRQEVIYPKNYIKMRNLENHDFGRIAGMVDEDETLLRNWHAFSFFNKGATMIFSGGEFSASKHPDLFNKDTISFEGNDLSPLIQKLHIITTHPIFASGVYSLKAENGALVGQYSEEDKTMVGIFNVSKGQGPIVLNTDKTAVRNLIDGELIEIKDGKLYLTYQPMIFEL